jgi:ferredoxin
MPKVIFESKNAPPVEVAAPQGGALIDLCDEAKADIPFSCRSANCGTCRIDVLEGMAELEPPEDDELAVLEIFLDDPAKRRLACQAKARPGLAILRVRPVEDEL